MSERHVTISGGHTQRPYGDHRYRYTVDFHLHTTPVSDYGGHPSADAARRAIDALTTHAVPDHATIEPAPDADVSETTFGELVADRWTVAWTEGYSG